MSLQKSIPMNATTRLYEVHRPAIDKALLDVAASGWWLGGTQTQGFSQEFSAFIGTTHCLPVGNGTDGLEIALRGLHSRNIGTQVICVANAGGYMATACIQVGLQPVFVDVDPKTLLMNLEAAVAAITSETTIVSVTHLYGGAVDVPKLRALMDDAGHGNLPILEDCAQAHGAQLSDGKLGQFGDAAVFSFYPTKNLGAMGDGGAIVTSDDELYGQLAQLAQYGWSGKYRIATAHGRNSRMDEIQAAVLRALLPLLDGWNVRRKEIYAAYATVCGKRIKPLHHKNDYVAHLAIFRANDRDRLRAFLKERNIATDIHYPILDCDQIGWQSTAMETHDLPISRAATDQIISLPCFPFLTDSEVETICGALMEWEQT